MDQEKSYEVLRNYGAKWAVLAAMELDLRKKGVQMSEQVRREIEMAQVKIGSGCYSPCQASCDLNSIEGKLISMGSTFGDKYMDQWMELMGLAMSGQLDVKKISEIPVLKPVESRCSFLECIC
jgi:hypothetical protein